MEATGADLATFALQALAGQSLVDRGHIIHHISPLVMQRAFHAQQGHTAAPLDSQRQLISVLMDMFAQLAQPALSHRLVFVLLVRHAQLARSLPRRVLQEPTSLSGARPLAFLAQPVTDAVLLPELENVERTITAQWAWMLPYFAQQEHTPKGRQLRRHTSARNVLPATTALPLAQLQTTPLRSHHASQGRTAQVVRKLQQELALVV